MIAHFWNSLAELVAHSDMVIDRPKGSPHPRYPDMIYPLDYGYLAKTTASDGAGIDIWLGSSASRTITGIICTVDGAKRDTEIKICISCTTVEMDMIRQFLENNGLGCLLIEHQQHPLKDLP